jgi:hypothetical protein
MQEASSIPCQVEDGRINFERSYDVFDSSEDGLREMISQLLA